MNRAEQEAIVSALRDSGVYWTAGERDGSGNIRRRVEVDWAAVVQAVMVERQWSPHIREPEGRIVGRIGGDDDGLFLAANAESRGPRP